MNGLHNTRFAALKQFKWLADKYESPPDDDEKHPANCRCKDCDEYEAERYYERLKEVELYSREDY